MEENSASIGLEWRRVFERTPSQERENVLKRNVVSCLKQAAVKSCIITRDPVLVIGLKDSLVQRCVIDAIEWFLFAEEPRQGRVKLSQLSSPPTICGKVFKNSEPTYSCRDCAIDATCVLCMTCFGNGIHKDHNYRLNTSSGGGCCDCGDEEAWKQGASCKIHSVKSEDSADEDPLKKLPEDFLSRARCLFNVLIDFCVNVLCEINEEELLSDIQTSPPDGNTHVTMLYNDESHTFQGVISALQKSLPRDSCTEKLANDFATVVDREGRSSIYIGSLENSTRVSESVQRNTSDSLHGPLRCETAHLYTVACQLMALKMMKWLDSLTEESDSLRRLHSVLSTTSSCGDCHLTRVLKADGKLWKVARFHNHQLFMNTLLKDSLGKQALAIEFTKNYPGVIDDYYNDDQDHAISAAGMSVQLFTVPSLVQMLSVHHNLMETVIQVLLEKTKPLLKNNGVFDFNKDERFKSTRLYWVIHDLRYIVQNKPNEWSDGLKCKFYRFLELFLSMLTRFQGMGMMKRATGVHVEMEQEWHRSYDFEMRFTVSVPLILQWCDENRDVLLKAIKLTLECLKDIRKRDGSTKLKKTHGWKKGIKVFDFDVASENVSMHIPIPRFLAGLLGCCEKHSINIKNVLEIKQDEDALMYMGFPLKVLVFVSQVKAGMWKRNGYTLLHQINIYRREMEMYAKDIFMMQVLASCMDKEYFLQVVLEMFKLHPWSKHSYNVDDKLDESALNQNLSLAGDFLHLLIMILGERYDSTIGQVENEVELKREVIHRLCLGNLSRSELMRGLPLSESEYQRRGKIDDVIASVATFKKPGLSSKGTYKVKKEFLSEFNPFFYHYDKNELSKAEDQMRKRCKEEGIPAVFIPPAPVEFLPQYSSIVDLLTCKKMIDMLTAILWRIKHGNPKAWTDRIFHQVLHLIGLALHEEQRQRCKGESFGFVIAATKQNNNFPKDCSLFECIETLQGNSIVELHSGLLSWTIQKFKEELSEQSYFAESSIQSSQPMDVSETVSHDQEKLSRQRLAQERREKILVQMSDMQKAFIRQNSELYLSTKTDLEDSELDETDSTAASSSEQAVIAIGNNRTPSVTIPREQFICILCQENPSSDERPLVYSAYVQRSTLLSNNHNQTLDEGDEADPLVSYRDQRVGTHVCSCGHVMHGDCWQRFFESILTTDRLSIRFRIRNTFDLTKREFLCPLCSGLGNTVLPIMAPTVTKDESSSNYVSWLVTLRKIQSKFTKDLMAFGQSKEEEGGFIKTLKGRVLQYIYQQLLSTNMQSMITVFTRAAYTFGLNVQPDDDNNRVALMVWGTCAYTIQCFEHSSREQSTGIVRNDLKREIDILRSLVYVANSASSISKSHDVVSHCLRLFSLLAAAENLPVEQRSMMEIDLFDWMVKMRFSLPSIDTASDTSQSVDGSSFSSAELDGFVFHLALAARIVQILLTTSEDIPSDEMDDYDDSDVVIADEIANFWRTLRKLCNPSTEPSSHSNPHRLLLHVRYRLLPFLRCCAIFFHTLNSTRVPLALRENFVTAEKEYEALAEYLAVPRSLTEIFGWSDTQKTFTNEDVLKVVGRWCLNQKTDETVENFESLKQNTLIQLPHNYSELINQASQYDCPVFSGDENRVPAKCLICGKWLCCEAWCCKETIGDQHVGSCTAHAQTCGAGVGMFLRVRDCIVLLVNGIGKGCFYPSPYLDAYGENDPGLRRGNPLFLCEERYKQLQKLWKQHGIPTEIVRHLESNRHLMQVDWANY
ncbi:E3 ubiquitin-protein ligase UBR2-like [Dendronephthya gigantea]|uniref:E3 ubiquitin-protein ligase UBR2-like n=1 Tax=Dendronephthya gigantea TaxID=151771 RepID=UPI00106A0C0A|nr:E3 ubiquitin-protein ligase UBR2-like [Dendronephthya gigantea]